MKFLKEIEYKKFLKSEIFDGKGLLIPGFLSLPNLDNDFNMGDYKLKYYNSFSVNKETIILLTILFCRLHFIR